ncbi:MAG: C40 family peptidase [Pseudomonadota bacterium]|nr:C40 family peptidase [Pseudomonadota bacterium]MDP1905406.1 C40 family peptidase [Pseudomonadota bacterium]MDP2354138.1 C40 family peptidase [Pseudomonadota bacterium]
MRALPTLLLLILALVATPALQAGETLSENLTAKTQPLLKALSMIGTPYKFGSNNPEKGLDCSGFVKYVYKETADVSLPRSASDMSKEGAAVDKEKLEPGDLVFFNTRKRANSHVGIYAGNGEFVHASSSQTKQVTVSRMDQKYWATRFNGARRVLPDTHALR